MKLLSALLLSLAALTYAADQSGQLAKPPAQAAAKTPSATIAPGDSNSAPGDSNSQVAKKMGPVTWDPDAHLLRWTVQTGTLVNGEFVPSSEQQYEISPDEATMGTADEKRGFDGDEAEGLHQLLDILSLYCAESVAWWDQSPGSPAQSKPVTPDSSSPQKPVKVRQPQPKPVPIPPGTQIAQLRANQ